MSRITVIGSVFVDIKGFALDTFIPGGRNRGRMEQVHGGVGRNTAENLILAGADTALVSLVSDDSIGTDITNHLREIGMDTSMIRRHENGMGIWIAVFDDKGEAVSSVSCRPDLSLMTEIIEEHREQIFRDSDLIVLEIDIEPETAELVCRYAQQYGKKVIALLSVMEIARERRNLLPMVHCFLCNQQEAGMLFHLDLSDSTPEEVLAILKEQLPETGLQQMIITMGAQGAVYAEQYGICGICPPEKAEVKDTTGAGDAFCSGTALALAEGTDLAQACRLGTKFAASVLSWDRNVIRPSDIISVGENTTPPDDN